MALLNNIYIFVQDEKVNHNITSVTHPVEEGIDLTDHVSAEAQEIVISGKIVGDGAAGSISAIVQMQKQGTLVSYVGRNFANNYQVISFNTSHPNTVAGGCEFDMTLREVRFAQSPYKTDKNTAGKNQTPLKEVTKTGTQQRQANSTAAGIYHTVKVGESAYSIAQKYRSKGATMAGIMAANPNAPKFKGDWTSLQVGTKVYVASR
jgi:hypothetical protein